MDKEPVSEQKFDLIRDLNNYAKKPDGQVGAISAATHIQNLELIIEGLVTRRRSFAIDAASNPVSAAGRAIDIAKIQPVIEFLRAAVEDERRISTGAPNT